MNYKNVSFEIQFDIIEPSGNNDLHTVLFRLIT